MANRFQEKFIRELVNFSKEYGFVITEGGVIEPINDWVEPSKSFEYTYEEKNNELKITGVKMV